MDATSAFIVWFKHSRRATTLAAEVGAKIHFVYETGLKRRWLTPLRYVAQSWHTWRFLERERPQAVLVQVPPIFAPLTVALWCKFRSFTGRRHIPYVIDSHTGSFYDPHWRWALPLLRWLARGAAVTIVASEAALATLKNWNVRGMFLLDGLPPLDNASGNAGTDGGRRMTIISGFGDDEPVEEVFAAARLLPEVTFYMSGDANRLPAHLRSLKPDNVIQTGFLPDGEYVGLLKHVHGLVDLTKVPHILTCGTYEAIAAGTPSLLSDWPQNRRYFPHGFVYVKNTPEEIAAGVQQVFESRSSLVKGMEEMRSQLEAQRATKLAELLEYIQRDK